MGLKLGQKAKIVNTPFITVGGDRVEYASDFLPVGTTGTVDSVPDEEGDVQFTYKDEHGKHELYVNSSVLEPVDNVIRLSMHDLPDALRDTRTISASVMEQLLIEFGVHPLMSEALVALAVRRAKLDEPDDPDDEDDAPDAA